jgi:hypothetical protein
MKIQLNGWTFAACLGVANILCPAVSHAGAGDIYVQQGRAQLASVSPSLALAEQSFALALSAEPTNRNANFFMAAVRLVRLVESANFQAAMTALGATSFNPNIYAFGMHFDQLNSDKGSAPAFTQGVTSQQARNFLLVDGKAALVASLNNLSQCSVTNFVLDVSPEEWRGSALQNTIRVDYGDVMVLRSQIKTLLCALEYLDDLNTQVIPSGVADQLLAGNVNIQSLLVAYPDLFKRVTTSRLANSKSYLSSAIDDYVVGGDFIRNSRTTPPPTGTDRLYSLDTPQDLDHETNYRGYLVDVKSALTGATDLYPEQNASPTRLNLVPAFNGTVSPRALLPVFGTVPGFVENYIHPSATYDSTLSGIIPNMTVADVQNGLLFAEGPSGLTVEAYGNEAWEGYGLPFFAQLENPGRPAARFQWLKDGKPLGPSSKSSYPDFPVSLYDAGNYQLRASNGVGSVTSPETMSINQVYSLGDLYNWRWAFFGTDENAGTAADTWDFDGDGNSNYKEYTQGTNPIIYDRVPFPFLVSGVGSIQLEFLKARSEVSYTIEESTTLQSWGNSPNQAESGLGWKSVTIPIVGSKKFFRLKTTP